MFYHLLRVVESFIFPTKQHTCAFLSSVLSFPILGTSSISLKTLFVGLAKLKKHCWLLKVIDVAFVVLEVRYLTNIDCISNNVVIAN